MTDMVEVPRELLETLRLTVTEFAGKRPSEGRAHVLYNAARAVTDATPLRVEDELTVTVLLCQSCGKQIGQSISAGTLALSDFNPAQAAEFTELKTCSWCKEDKPLSEFHRNPRTRDKRSDACKACRSKRAKEIRAMKKRGEW
jgi:hypothetical protein